MQRHSYAAFGGGMLALFPDGEETYELIYAPRFKRLIDEFASVSDGRRPGVVIPFPLGDDEVGPPQSSCFVVLA